MTGVKNDDDKIMCGLVLSDFARALTEVCKVGTFGAKKYSAHGWLDVPDNLQRYDNAMLRHWLAEASGEDYDPESGLLHAAHTAWNALACLELLLREN